MTRSQWSVWFRRRRNPLRAVPERHLTPGAQTGAWDAVGDDPIFELIPDSRGFPARWVEIDIPLRASVGSLTPSLYVDGGEGYSERDRLLLPEPGGDHLRFVVRLPNEVKSIRFDPMDSPGSFQMGAIHFVEISPLEAGLKLALRLLRRPGPKPWSELRRVGELLVRGRVLEAKRLFAETAAISSRTNRDYLAWLAARRESDRDTLERMKRELGQLKAQPVFSIVMPTYESPEIWLTKAIESVRAQVYPHWELCIADDRSRSPHVARILKAAAAKDDRVKLAFRETNGHIAEATNTAMGLATGEFLVFMDHDDEITPDALFRFAEVVNRRPDVDFIYSDEDKITEKGMRYEPFFKPDWAPEYLESCMYTAHLAAYRRDIVDRIGGLRSAHNGAQDYDFTLRYTEHVKVVEHVPHILYHWRAIPGSTAQSMDNKDYVIDAAVRALEERLTRTGRTGTVEPDHYRGCFNTRADVVGEPLVSIVIPSAGRDHVVRGETVDLLAECIRSVREKSTYRNYEIIVVDNGDLRASTKAAIKAGGKVRYTTFKEPVFNIAKKMNQGARLAKGEFLLFLNDDIEVIAPDWLEAMVALGQRDGMGSVGAKLFFEDGTLQHVGVTFADGLPDHIRRCFPGDDPGYNFSTVAQRNYSAVTGACVLVPRAAFRDVGGFDERLAVNYNDIDLCLALGQAGLRTVYCPHAELYHYESISRERTVDPDEAALFLDKWRDVTPVDPFYSEHFGARPPNFELK